MDDRINIRVIFNIFNSRTNTQVQFTLTKFDRIHSQGMKSANFECRIGRDIRSILPL